MHAADNSHGTAAIRISFPTTNTRHVNHPSRIQLPRFHPLLRKASNALIYRTHDLSSPFNNIFARLLCSAIACIWLVSVLRSKHTHLRALSSIQSILYPRTLYALKFVAQSERRQWQLRMESSSFWIVPRT